MRVTRDDSREDASSSAESGGKPADLSTAWFLVPFGSMVAIWALRQTTGGMFKFAYWLVPLTLWSVNAGTALIAAVILIVNRRSWRAWLLLLWEVLFLQGRLTF